VTANAGLAGWRNASQFCLWHGAYYRDCSCGERVLEVAGSPELAARGASVSWIVDTLTSAEKAIAARKIAAMRPSVAALAGIAAPEGCRDELSGIDVAAGGWDIRARWFGVVICATPRLGKLGRGVTISWRFIAAQQPRRC
jgi:hypothetical protein